MKNRSFGMGRADQRVFFARAAALGETRRVGLAAALCVSLLIAAGVWLIEVRGALATPGRAQAGGGNSPTYTFTTIDVPGAGTGVLQGTIGSSLNVGGDVTGVYLTAPNVAHGFVRAAATGAITPFDAPNAGTGKNQGTFPIKIEAAGNTTGMYADAVNAYHGFLRAPDGTMTEFDVAGAPTNIGHRGTFPLSINAALEITGFYVDSNAVRHGFLRAADGTFTIIDVPGAGTGPTQGTNIVSINALGGVAGFYIDGSQGFHGFVRNSKGTITSPIDDPNAGTGTSKGIRFRGTVADGFDTETDIAGIYTDASSVFHGFLIDINGNFTSIDVPGAGTAGLFPGTLLTNMDGVGDVTGTYSDANGVGHGFVRLLDTGAINAPIDAPGAGTTGMFSGTVPFGINVTGELAGAYADANGVFHGFLATASEVATPSFSPAAGTYATAQSVTISDVTPNSAIFYTTDGTTPSTASTQFTAPIMVNSTETIEAVAAADGFSNSAVATATYTIGSAGPPAATPTFSPAAGTYTSVQTVTISDATAGATIYYTTNGTTPTTTSTVFTAPIAVNSTETIEALATASGFSNSAVATATYTLNLPAPDFQVSVNPSTLTIVAGQSGKATFTVTPENGFNAPVNFACSGLPSEAACSFSPTSVTPNGAAITSTLTVTTTAASTAAAMLVPLPSSQRPVYAVGFPVLALIFGIAARRRRELRGLQLLGLLILLMGVSVLTSCNGGSVPVGNPGTPVGTSAVSVSASASGAGAINHAATLTITITH
jgi:hypothetical protein